LSHLDYLDEAMQRLSTEIEQRLQEGWAAVEVLDSVPGISQRAAEFVVAELGIDLQRFPSTKHLASWAGMCPGNKESGGKGLTHGL
jgi:transposase